MTKPSRPITPQISSPFRAGPSSEKSHPPRLSAVDENEPPHRLRMPASRRPACRSALRSLILVALFNITDILRTRWPLPITGHFLTFRNTRRPPGTPLWQGADPSRPPLFPHARRAEYARSALSDRAHTECQSDAFLLPAPLFATAKPRLFFCKDGVCRRFFARRFRRGRGGTRICAGLSASADFYSIRTFRSRVWKNGNPQIWNLHWRRRHSSRKIFIGHLR